MSRYSTRILTYSFWLFVTLSVGLVGWLVVTISLEPPGCARAWSGPRILDGIQPD